MSSAGTLCGQTIEGEGERLLFMLSTPIRGCEREGGDGCTHGTSGEGRCQER